MTEYELKNRPGTGWGYEPIPGEVVIFWGSLGDDEHHEEHIVRFREKAFYGNPPSLHPEGHFSYSYESLDGYYGGSVTSAEYFRKYEGACSHCHGTGIAMSKQKSS